jgi:hypothetical protein
MAEAGEGPEVALEATYGYCWAADLLKDNRANVHLGDSRRVKNDVKETTELAKRLWRGDLPEARVAPPEVRALREPSPLTDTRVGPVGTWQLVRRAQSGARGRVLG